MDQDEYEAAWATGDEIDQPLVDAVHKARKKGEREREEEYRRAYRAMERGEPDDKDESL